MIGKRVTKDNPLSMRDIGMFVLSNFVSRGEQCCIWIADFGLRIYKRVARDNASSLDAARKQALSVKIED